jgi:hypothetical protein
MILIEMEIKLNMNTNHNHKHQHQHKQRNFTATPHNPLSRQTREQPTIPGIWKGIKNPLG